MGVAIGNGFVNPLIQSDLKYNLARAAPQDSLLKFKEEQIAKIEFFRNPINLMVKQCNNVGDPDNGGCAVPILAFKLSSGGFPQSPFVLNVLRGGLEEYEKETGQPGVLQRLRAGLNLPDPPAKSYNDAMQAFLELPANQVQLGLIPTADDTPVTWIRDNTNYANRLFLNDYAKDYSHYLPALLEKGIKVLAYAGDADYFVTSASVDAWTKKLEWSGKKQFNIAKLEKVTSKSESTVEVGLKRSHGGLTFHQVYNAGHSVPKSKPKAAFEMINAFIADDVVKRETTGIPAFFATLGLALPAGFFIWVAATE